MAAKSAHLRADIKKLSTEYERILEASESKGGLSEADVQRLQAMDPELSSMTLQYKAALADEARQTKNRQDVEAIFAGQGDNRPTHDGSRQFKSNARGFGGAVVNAGFDLRSNPAVTIPLSDAMMNPYEMKASLDITGAAIGTHNVRRVDGIQSIGQDSRWLWPHLQTQDIGDATSVEDFRQDGSRTITGSVERAVAAVTEKATLDVSIDHVVAAVKTLAVILDEIPVQILRSLAGIEEFLNSEGIFALNTALDQHVLAAILAATPPNGLTGADLFEQIRTAISAMRLLGSEPDLIVVNPTDAVAIDTMQDNENRYYYGGPGSGFARALWGLTIIEHTTVAGTQAPVLIDTQRIGKLFRGTLRIEADQYTHFTTNRVNIRAEFNALMHVRAADGAYIVEA